MGKDSSQFLTSLYLGSLSILSFSSCNAESITVFGTPINSPIKYKGVLFDLDSCAIFMSKKKLCETNRPRVFYCPPTGIIFLFLFFQTGKTGMRESYFLLWLPHHRKDLGLHRLILTWLRRKIPGFGYGYYLSQFVFRYCISIKGMYLKPFLQI